MFLTALGAGSVGAIVALILAWIIRKLEEKDARE